MLEDSKDYEKLVNFDEGIFSADMESVASLVPYLKANPAFKIMIDSFVECPSQCTMDHCNNHTARISIVYFSSTRKDAGTTLRSRPG
jgi:hypothetical protein